MTQPHLALFDLDETLIHGDCATLWAEYMVTQGWVADINTFLAAEAALMQQYAAGTMNMGDYMALTLAPLKGQTVADVSSKVAQFIHDVIAPIVYPAAKDVIAMHQQKGERLIVISASGAHLVHPIAAALGIHESIAIDIEIEQGRFTGNITGIPSFREGKVIRLLELIHQDESQLRDASFYSDSRNDIPLLERVGHPIAINPDPRLRQVATENQWSILHWQLTESSICIHP